MATQRFPVEAAHVMMFARAVGDPNPVYVDPERADGPCLAPPTFGIAADHFDPDYERRPRPGVPWFGSGARPISVEGGTQQPTGGGSGFHAQEHFSYHRPLRGGDVLFGSARPGANWHKQGRRGGKLSFREHLTEYRDADGEPVLTLSWVDVLTERVVDGGETRATEARSEAAPKESTEEQLPEAVPVQLRDAELAPGSVHEQLLVEDLKRTQIVMYAGASGDFHPMHTDEAYARAINSRFPGRWISKLVVQALPLDDVKSFRDAGVQIYHPNYEVWDRRLFPIICPGKDDYVGRDEWMKRIVDSAEIFGPSQVIPNFVAGVEMAAPHGFKTVEEALESTGEGLDYFMSQGITPRFTVWCPEPLSVLGKDQGPAPLEYHVGLLRLWRETLLRYGLPAPPGYGEPGVGKAVFSVSSFMDALPGDLEVARLPGESRVAARS